ncbi:MAG: hypothetical protein QS748_03330 [Candidatus Endonucleobacter bathymodioli]|uniref:Uncharacterized protein n=1 Tax=Candidatus Endonucleibacter bathymodioli TaxID=539814 RepID=A0AA90SCM1_9GAMM|nr:hypothetical protein [Candidatus Endonucleobacter bathymodioli]
MAVNRAETTKIIIDHREAFFRMIDETDRSGQGHQASEEFTVARYERYLSISTKNVEKKERRVVLDALSVTNLKRNKMLVFSHDQTGRFLLVGWLREMLRSFDDMRLRGLTQPDLNHLHERLAVLLAQVKNPQVLWIDNDLGFNELVRTVHDVFNDVAYRLTQNVAALKGRCDALAKIVDSANYSSMDRPGQIAKALEEIYSIHERNVIPTLRFLDPKLAIKRTVNTGGTSTVINDPPMRIVEQVIERFEESKKRECVEQLKRVEFQILSLSDEVTILRQSLEQYIQLVEAQRRRYEVIEKRYNRLRDEVRDRQDGRRRGFRIPIDSPIFDKATKFQGLKDHRARKGGLLDWPKGAGREYLKEHLRVIREKKAVEAVISRAPRTRAEVDPNTLKLEHKLRGMLTLMDEYSLPCPCGDVFLELHDHLEGRLYEYELPDIVEAIGALREPLTASATQKNTIEHGKWSYTYHVRSLSDDCEAEEKHV